MIEGDAKKASSWCQEGRCAQETEFLLGRFWTLEWLVAMGRKVLDGGRMSWKCENAGRATSPRALYQMQQGQLAHPTGCCESYKDLQLMERLATMAARGNLGEIYSFLIIVKSSHCSILKLPFQIN